MSFAKAIGWIGARTAPAAPLPPQPRTFPIADLQALLAAEGFDPGLIDGDLGPRTWAAIGRVENAHRGQYPFDPKRWPESRRVVGAGQVLLMALQFEPGAIDGYYGHNTREALTAWRSQRGGVTFELVRPATGNGHQHKAQAAYPRQKDMVDFYGAAGGPQCTAGTVVLPVPHVLAWNQAERIHSFACHERLAQPMSRLFAEAVRHYGRQRYEALGLTLFGGCYNFRNMRHGARLSTHAWGAAIDLNPEENQLRWGADRARFAQPEYEAFWNIAMAQGATPAGIAWGRDWMHMQWARL